MNEPSQPSATYENNPFFIATKGIELLFNKAKSIGILFALLSGLALLSGIPSAFMNPGSQPAGDPTLVANNQLFSPEALVLIGSIVLVLLLVVIAVSIVLSGIADYSSAKIAKGETVDFNQALRAVFDNFWGYTWVMFIATVKVFLWSLLFIIPGFIMYYRYSLSGVVYFDTHLKGNRSVKRSAELTKNAWLTTYGSKALLDRITFGAISALLTPGTNAMLYRQFSTIPAGERKPKAHFLSILALVIPIILFTLVVALLAFIFATFDQPPAGYTPAQFI